MLYIHSTDLLTRFFDCVLFHFYTGDICTALVRLPRLLKYPTMSKFFDLTDR